jgi:hypothetical protein
MGGAGAPDYLEKGSQTQVCLAVRDEPGALIIGQYLHHEKQALYTVPPTISLRTIDYYLPAY